MTQNEFNVVLEQQYRKCADMLAHKKKEYTGDRIDRLNAFKSPPHYKDAHLKLLWPE